MGATTMTEVIPVFTPLPIKLTGSSGGLPRADGAGLHPNDEGHPCSEDVPKGTPSSRHLLINCHHSQRDCKIGDTLGAIIYDPILEPYYDEVVDFINWLEKTKNITIILKGYTHYPEKDGEIQPFTEFGYRKKTATRWSDDYTNILLARLYRLQEVTRDTPVLMASFTVPHEYNKFRQLKNPGNNHLVCFDLLKRGWDRFRKRIAKKYGHTPCVRIWEAHPGSGYPHFHAAMFRTFTDDDKEWLKDTWADCIGYPQHRDVALDISDICEINHPLAYMMKYLGKTLYDGWQDWTPEEWVFNALLWTTGTRSFQPSRDLGRIMKDRPAPEGKNTYTHVLVEGLPRKTEENNDLPVLIAAPDTSREKYEREATLNPDIAPFVPLHACIHPSTIEPLQDRISRFKKAHGITGGDIYLYDLNDLEWKDRYFLHHRLVGGDSNE